MLKKTLKGRFAPPALSTLSQPELSSVLGGRAHSQSSKTAAAERTVRREEGGGRREEGGFIDNQQVTEGQQAQRPFG